MMDAYILLEATYSGSRFENVRPVAITRHAVVKIEMGDVQSLFEPPTIDATEIEKFSPSEIVAELQEWVGGETS